MDGFRARARRPTQRTTLPQPTGPESSNPESTPHYPSSLQHVRAAIMCLRLASHDKLPDEILKPMLYHADYDCLHFTAASSKNMVRYGGYDGSKLCKAIAYVETEPLTGLSQSADGGRIRRLHIHATGKHQGWADDPQGGSWSWFEVRKRLGTTVHDCEGFTWAHNALVEKDWRNHEMIYHVDDESEDQAQMRKWVQTLQNGDRVSIVPMAQFPGWKNSVQEAGIDVEVEVWG